MKHTILNAQKRLLFGHKARKLRRDGLLPAVVYSKKHSSEHVQVDQREFYALFKLAGYTNVVDLNIEDKTLPVIVQDIDVNPVTGQARHIDFLVVNLKEKIQTVVPIEFVGVSSGVKDLGAVLSVVLDEVEVEALPDNIPNQIELDISSLVEIGDSLSVADITKDPKYSILADDSQIVVSLSAGATGIEESVAPEQVIPETTVEETAETKTGDTTK